MRHFTELLGMRTEEEAEAFRGKQEKNNELL
jgi:hypothetical protein